MTHATLLTSGLFATALALAPTGTVTAQTPYTTPPSTTPSVILAEAAVTALDKVAFLTALAKIESDIKLGVLFVFDGKEDAAALHFSRPRAETIPTISGALQSLKLVDFETRFADLEAATGKDAIAAAVKQAMRELSKARLKVKPTAKDKFHSMVAQLEAAAALLNPNSPTETAAFQDSWGMVMVARDQIDLFARGKDLTLLGRTPDKGMIDGAKTLGFTIDIVLLDLPDPAVPVPVALDRAIFAQAITEMAKLAE